MKIFLSQLCIAFFFVSVVSAQYSPNDVLLTINNKPVTAEEFERIYHKNYNINSSEKQGVNDYFGLFLKFKLKVTAATDAKLDTLPSYQKELKGYRDQLAKNYLTDNRFMDSLVREAYDHMLYDVNVSHILTLFPENSALADTLQAYKKIMAACKKIEAGEAFEKVADEYSEDPSVRMNHGNIGYFTAFRFPYQFESCAYHTKVGEMSVPLRTHYGYHIIKVNDRRPSPGEVKVAHIMVMVRRNAPDTAWTNAKRKIEGYAERIKNGENFGAIARKYSDDKNSGEADGELAWFGTGRMVAEFEAAAFGLKTPGEISQPIRTAYGWHLVKLIDKRSVAGFDKVKNDLKTKVLNDERADMIKASFIEKLKKQYTCKIFAENLTAFQALDSTVYDGKINVLAEAIAKPMLTIQNKTLTGADFKSFLEANPVSARKIPVKEYIGKSFGKFVENLFLNYEDQQLETKYSDFGNMVNEYHDGILLFDIMDRQVWSQAARDSAGLKQFYQNQRNKPTWGKRADAGIFTCKNMQIAEKVKKIIADTKKGKITDSQIVKMVCDSASGAACLSIDHKLFSKGDSKFIDSIAWKRGYTGFTTMHDKIIFAYIWEIRKPEIKNIDEVRGLVTADYQNYLEEKWIESLKNKYNIVINQELLHKIADKYKKNP
jgi:peptidyl-prolyl cis-trans isomerase SurA